VALGAALLAGVAGCTTSGAGNVAANTPAGAASSIIAAPATVSPTAPAATRAPTTSATSSGAAQSSSAPRSHPARHRSSAPAAASSSAAAAPPASSSAAAPPIPQQPKHPACDIKRLTVVGVRGGAYQGREIAGVLFTNDTSAACTVSGYASAQLLRNGQPIGRPANNNPGTVRTVLLHHGQTAEAQLTAVTTCQAPVSDAARVGLPDSDTTVEVSVELRACSLSIDPLRLP
jgi:hypothetical protein